jgi:membrane protein DedA with SNARE-associated domain
MPLWRFGLLTLAGSFIWNAVFVLSGYLLGDQWHIVEEYAGVLQYAVIAVAATALVWFTVNRVRQLRGASADSDPA